MKTITMNKMAMKSGKKILVTIGLSCCLIAVNRLSKKNMVKMETFPRLDQYLNRLKEFYSEDMLAYMEDEFLTLVDFGLSPHRAFESIVKDGAIV